MVIDASTCRIDIPDFKPDHIFFTSLVWELPSGYVYPVIALNEYGYAFDVSLVGLVPAQDEGFSDLQSSSLTLVSVLHHCSAAFHWLGFTLCHKSQVPCTVALPSEDMPSSVF